MACIVAAMSLGPDGALPEGFDASTLDPSCMVPSRAPGEPGMIILGTLDVNQGVSLPAEELAGYLPYRDDPVREGTDCSQDGLGSNAGVAGGAGRGEGGGEWVDEGGDEGVSDGR